MKTVYHPTLPTSQDVPDEDVADWVEQGWLSDPPAGVDPDFDVESSSIPEVLAHVGSDPARIAAALATESGRGDQARPSLVQKLEKLTQEGSN